MSRLSMKNGRIVIDDDQDNTPKQEERSSRLSMENGRIIIADTDTDTPAVNKTKNEQYRQRTQQAQRDYLAMNDYLPQRNTSNVMDMAIDALRNRVANSTVGKGIGEWVNRISAPVSPEERARRQQDRIDRASSLDQTRTALEEQIEARQKQRAIDNALLIDQASSQYQGPTMTERGRRTVSDLSGADMFSNDWVPDKTKEIEYERTIANPNYTRLDSRQRDEILDKWESGNLTEDEYQNYLYLIEKNGGLDRLKRERVEDMSRWDRFKGTASGVLSSAGENLYGSYVLGNVAKGYNMRAGQALDEYGQALDSTARRWFWGLVNGADDPEIEQAVRTAAAYIGGDKYADLVVNRVRERAEAAANSGDDPASFEYGLLDDIEPESGKLWENLQGTISDTGIYEDISNVRGSANRHLEQAKELNNIQDVIGYDAASNIMEGLESTLENAADALIAGALGFAGSGLSYIPFIMRSLGGSYAGEMQEATAGGRQLSLDDERKASLTSGFSAGIEYLTERMWGIGGALGKRVTGGGALDDLAQDALSKAITGFAKTETGAEILLWIGEKLLGGATEGLEEIAGNAAEQLLKMAGIMPGEPQDLAAWWEDTKRAGAAGFWGGIFGNATNIVAAPLQQSQIGKQLKAGALDISLSELTDLANAEGMENTSLAKAYSDLFSGLPRSSDSFSDVEAGKLYEAYEETVGKRTEAVNRINEMQEKLEAGKELTRADVNRITNNSDAVSVLVDTGAVTEEALHGDITERRDAVEMALRAFANASETPVEAQAENVQPAAGNASTPIIQRQMDFDAAIAAAQNAQQFNASEIARQHDPQQMLLQNMARSMYAVGDAAERLGASRQAQDVMARMYEPSQDTIEYAGQMTNYYKQGKAGNELDISDLQNVSAVQAQAAFNVGRMEKIREEQSNEAEGTELRVRSGVQGNDSQSAGGQSQRVEEAPGSVELREGTAGFERRRPVSGVYSQPVSAASLGIRGGSENRNIRVLTNSNDKAVQRAQQLIESRGYKAVLFTGGALEINGEQARGYYDPETNTIYVRADHRLFTAEQIAQHEVMHDRIRNGEVDLSAVKDDMIKRLGGTERFERTMRDYYALYEKTGMSFAQIFEEAVCDAAGNMNEFLYHGHWNDANAAVSFYKTANESAKATERTGKGQIENGAMPKFSREVKYLTTEDDNLYLAAGTRGNFTRRNRYNNGERVVLRSSEDVRNYISNVLDGKTEGVVAYSKVPDRLVDDVKTATNGRIDLSGLFMELVPDNIKHAFNEHHTAKEEGNIDIPVEYFLSIPEIIENYSSVVSVTTYKKTNMTTVRLDYAIDDGHIIVVEVVSKRHGSVEFKNMFGLTDERFEEDYGKNKKSGANSRGQTSADNSTRQDATTLSATNVTEQNEPVKGKFSMDRPVEMTKDLVALHNLSEDKLLKAIKLGGFPMPSIAVTKSNIPHTNFGDITLVMNRSTVDPEMDSRNTVYSADAWTPTFPNVEYEANPAAEKRLRDLFYRLERQYGREVSEALYGYGNYLEDQLNRMGGIEGILKREENNTGMMKAYLKLQGKDIPETVVKETVERIDDQTAAFYDDLLAALGDASAELDAYRSPRLGREWFDAHEEQIKEGYRKYFERAGLSEEDVNNFFENESWGSMYANLKKARKYQKNGKETRKTETDYAATEQAVRDAVDQEAYKKWLHEIFDNSVKSEGIYNGRDYYDRNGNLRSFSWTHVPVTLNNIAKAMAAQNDGNSRNVSGFYGVKSLRAGTAERFKNIADMHKLEGRLKHLTQEEADAINDELGNRLSALMQKILDTAPKSYDSNSFMEMDAIGNILMEISEDTPITIDKIMNRFKGTSYKVTVTSATEIRDLLFDISQMPVNIFEAKPERAVRFDEVLAAIVPTGTSTKLVDGLKSVGVENVMEYEKGNDKDRMAKVNSVEGARFSRDLDGYLMEHHKEYENDETNRKIAAEGVQDLIKGAARVSAAGGEVDMAKQRKDIRTLGNGISAQFVKTGRINLNGTRIRSAEDLAQVGQIFRNPKFETMRYLYVKKGKIVGTDSVTAMLPGLSPVFSKDFQEADLLRKIARAGADGVYLLHNHPSGDVTPSREDFGVTGKLAETIQNNTKAKFMGHVVIDHETYAQIDVDTNNRTANWERKEIPGQGSFDFLLTPSLDNDSLGKQVLNPGSVAAVGKEVVNGSDYSAIIYASSKGYVRQLQEVSDKALKNNKQIGNYIRNQRVNSGAGMAFVYTKDRAVYDALVQVYGDDILTDVVLDGAEFKDMRKNVFQREGMYMGVKEGDIVGVHANEEQTEYSYGVTQKELNEYVDGAYSGTNQESIKKYLAVDERLVDDVSDEIPDIKEYSHALRDNDIRHIRNSHGEESGEKYPVTEDDIKAVPFIVQNYDKVIVKHRNGAPGIVYVKVADDNLVYYLEAVTDQYRNEKLLINKQMIKTGLEDIPNLVGLKDAIQKKQSLTSFLADLNQIHEAYAQSASMQETASTDNIVREDSLVKGNFSRDLANTELYDANRQLQKDLTELRRQLKTKTEQYKYWKGQTKVTEGRQLRIEDVTKLAREIIKGQESSADAKDVAEKMKALGEYLLNSQDEDVYEEARMKAYAIAHDILSQAKVLNTKGGEDFYKDFRSLLKGYNIYVAPSVREELAPDGWNDFRKSLFGTVNMTADQNKGKSVDKVYHDLQATFGEWLLPEYITSEADQLNKILEIIETYRPVYENLNSYEMADAVEWTANEILTRIIGNEIRETNPTYADRMEKKLADQKAKAQTALKQVRRQRDRKVADLKEHYRQVAEDRRNRKIDSEMRSRLLKWARRVNNMKLPRVAGNLRDLMIGDLDTVAKSITGQKLGYLQALEDWYLAEQQNDPNFFQDKEIEAQLKRLHSKHINDLTQEEVADLITVLQNFEAEWRHKDTGEMIDSAVNVDRYAAAMNTIDDIANTNGRRRGNGGKADRLAQSIDAFFVDNQLSPTRAMKRITGYHDGDPLSVLTKEVSDGYTKKIAFMMEANRMFDKWLNDKKFCRSLMGKHARTITVRGAVGMNVREFHITPAMGIGLYLASMNDDNMRHIAQGGIQIADLDRYRKGDLKGAFDTGEIVKITREAAKAVESQLTNEEKAFANTVYTYFNSMAPNAINDVSEVVSGYAKARVKNYYPIRVLQTYLDKNAGEVREGGTPGNAGFLNERTTSTKPIVLMDVVDVLRRSIDENSTYVGLEIPIRNFNLLSNTRVSLEDGSLASVKDMIQRKWGDEADKYITKMISDVQGKGKGESTIFNNIVNVARGNQAKAALHLNAGTGIKQAASLPTAAAVLGTKPIVRSITTLARKVDPALIRKYTPLYDYRALGYSTLEIGDIREKKAELPKALKWIEAIDLWTVRRIWRASEYYVLENNKDLKPYSEEFYKEVKDIWEQTVQETQPNYTPMQRSQSLRSDGVERVVHLFKTQPYQNFNILYDAFAEAHAKRVQMVANTNDETKANYKKAKTGLARAVGSQIVSSFVFALMQYVVDLARGKKKKYQDDDGEDDILAWMKAMGLNMLSNGFGVLPLGSLILEGIENAADMALKAMGKEAFFGQKYYGLSDPTIDAINDAGSYFGSLINKIGNYANGNNSSETFIRNMVDAVSELSALAGIPVGNGLRTLQSITRIVLAGGTKAGLLYDGNMLLAEYNTLRLTTDPAKYKSDYYALLEKALRHDEAAYAEIYNKMIGENGFATESNSAKTNVDASIKKWGYVLLKDAWGRDENEFESLRQKMLNLPGDPFATKDKTAEQNIDAKIKEWKKGKAQNESFYQDTITDLQATEIWRQSDEKHQQTTINTLLSLAAGLDDDTQAKIDGGKSVGIDSTEYLLYKLALSITNPGGGNPTQGEAEAAARMVDGLTPEEMSYLYMTSGKNWKYNPFEVTRGGNFADLTLNQLSRVPNIFGYGSDVFKTGTGLYNGYGVSQTGKLSAKRKELESSVGADFYRSIYLTAAQSEDKTGTNDRIEQIINERAADFTGGQFELNAYDRMVATLAQLRGDALVSGETDAAEYYGSLLESLDNMDEEQRNKLTESLRSLGF